ncbi:aminoglycoside phosphotransferase family protein [Pseudooceanicola sp. LIPI14-2-Ac024]|uniref:aminoglycoside phosphotransferase family protein n=1 Tax=Pseudooceanicola sp. LIPI14-2-Ac024 TaxID=3344875 RepID=UPI0035CEBFC5
MTATDLPPEVARRFGVTRARPVDHTAIAAIWRVEVTGGGVAALKLFHHDGLSNEGPGLDWMRAQDGAGVVQIIATDGRAVLMEWQDGPSLGDVLRAGEAVEADAQLLSVARALHDGPDLAAGVELPDLSGWFSALRDLRTDPGCPPAAARDMGRARDLALALLADPREVRALHGDLHHDNIRQGRRGWLAFDAKGVRGERAYELANAFRNPKGAAGLVADPATIARRADLWSEGFGVDRRRMLEWAAAKCALSITWRAKGPVREDAEFALLARLLEAAGAD